AAISSAGVMTWEKPTDQTGAPDRAATEKSTPFRSGGTIWAVAGLANDSTMAEEPISNAAAIRVAPVMRVISASTPLYFVDGDRSGACQPSVHIYPFTVPSPCPQTGRASCRE